MVNGNYVLYGDRPCSETEYIEDHVVQAHTVERKSKRKPNRTANELQHTLNMAQQLDNETDSIKFEKKVKEPRLLRYVSTSDVEENYVTEKFETYDLKPTEERPPRRYAFVKKPKNPADGSANYAYSRSSSSCSSPNGNLPTISEHGEQYGTYRVAPLSSTVSDIISGYENKLDKYFAKPREVHKFTAKGSHPDSLYRVQADHGIGSSKMTRILRVLRWPIALVVVCVALAVFVYFLMPENIAAEIDRVNGTYWEEEDMVARLQAHSTINKHEDKPPENQKQKPEKQLHPQGSKTTPEIDFYDADKKVDYITLIDKTPESETNRKLPIPPVFPSHITPEVQYGNEKADTENLRSGKLLEDINEDPKESTLKPHITQQPEKPLAIYFNEGEGITTTKTSTTETIARTEIINDYTTFEDRLAVKEIVKPEGTSHLSEGSEIKEETKPEKKEFNNLSPINFTSGHSKYFGISIEDAERMQSTTQSSAYNTRVSPTLPTWRDRDDATTKKYPINFNIDAPQCRSTHLALCRGILPYDLAGPAISVSGVDVTALLPQIDYLVATNCSERVRHVFCALLEPECSPQPYQPKMPCYNMCKAVMDNCYELIPRELRPVLNCNQYLNIDCVAAKSPCYTREMTCNDGTCVLKDWICDGNQDCPSGEDEATCSQCDNTEYRCRSGTCILKRWLCDGFVDCPGGEDEDENHCENKGNVQSLAHGEAGEESAGSAPAPSVRRPNRLPSSQTRSWDRGENDSSKELLVTSDSSNALRRNYTRRPPLSRLTPYNIGPRPTSTEEKEQNRYLSKILKTPTMRRYPTEKEQESTTVQYLKNEEQTQLLDAINNQKNNQTQILGFKLEDIKSKDMDNIFHDLYNNEDFIKKNDTFPFNVPGPISESTTEKSPVTIKDGRIPQTTTRLEKSISNLERVIDGAALRKSALETNEKFEGLESDEPSVNHTSVEKSDEPQMSAGMRGVGTAHTSPCPAGELRCVDGRCITLSQLCDGTIDCSDHADEDNCYT